MSGLLGVVSIRVPTICLRAPQKITIIIPYEGTIGIIIFIFGGP